MYIVKKVYPYANGEKCILSKHIGPISASATNHIFVDIINKYLYVLLPAWNQQHRSLS